MTEKKISISKAVLRGRNKSDQLNQNCAVLVKSTGFISKINKFSVLQVGLIMVLISSSCSNRPPFHISVDFLGLLFSQSVFSFSTDITS